MEFNTIGVVGAGTMGHGIAQVFATSGYAVLLSDLAPPLAEQAVRRIENNLVRLIEKGKLTAEERATALKRIRVVEGLDALADAQLVVEAVSEDAEIKLDLFRRLDGICHESAILATNTSSIPITRIARITGRPEQVIGMHFMNPVPIMALVEIIRGFRTSEEVYNAIENLTRKLGKTPVNVSDSPGFVSNRILLPMINEAIFALHEGIASAADIDSVMKLGMNHPMGPLALADLIGLDTCVYILDVLYEGFRDSKYRACPLLRKMVDAGALGRKSGRGFYDYAE